MNRGVKGGGDHAQVGDDPRQSSMVIHTLLCDSRNLFVFRRSGNACVFDLEIFREDVIGIDSLAAALRVLATF